MCRCWEAEKHLSPSGVTSCVCHSISLFVLMSLPSPDPHVSDRSVVPHSASWQLTDSRAEGGRDGTRMTQLMHLSRSVYLSLSILPLQPEILLEPSLPAIRRIRSYSYFHYVFHSSINSYCLSSSHSTLLFGNGLLAGNGISILHIYRQKNVNSYFLLQIFCYFY